MRIAIDARTICDADGGPGAGIEHYTWSLVFALIRQFPKDRFLLFVPPQLSAERRLTLVGSCRNTRLICLPTRIPFLSRQISFPLRLYALQAQVLFVPTPHLPVLWRGPSLITVHDMAIFSHPEWFPTGDSVSLSTRRLVPNSLIRATRIAAVSAYTAECVAAYAPSTAHRVDVVYPGVLVPTHVTGTSRFVLPSEFVLCLGTIEPRKNLVQAIYAFDRFLSAHTDRAPRLRLVLAGKWGWKTEEVQVAMDTVNEAWKDFAPDGLIHSLGPVSEDEKWELLSHTSALFFPSLEEGFGLPVLEAMALGVPVICSDRGALPEVVADAGLICPPDDVERMALLLAQVILLPEASAPLSEVGQQRASSFTWEATANGIMKSLEKVVYEKPSSTMNET